MGADAEEGKEEAKAAAADDKEEDARTAAAEGSDDENDAAHSAEILVHSCWVGLHRGLAERLRRRLGFHGSLARQR